MKYLMMANLDPQLGAVAVAAPDTSRVLLNLCPNALHAGRARRRAGGPAGARAYEPTVTVSTRRQMSRPPVEIRVPDNGPKIAAGLWEHIFWPFFTTKPVGTGPSRSHDGVTTGHGGTLTVERRPGEGTESLIILPEQ